jgi:hypothetical protein
MLRTNLATRPFYNERLVHLVLALVAVLVLAWTAGNVTQIAALSRRNTEESRAAQRDEARVRDLERQTVATRRGVSDAELRTLADAAREANAIIDQRMFSWTELFNRIETTLPPDVMITSVRPSIEKDVVSLSIVILGRRVEDIDTFMERLEGTGSFSGLLSRQEEVTDRGMFKAVLQGRYLPSRTEAAPAPGN